MQFEIPEDAHVHIVIGKPTSWAFSPRTCSAGKAYAGLGPEGAGELVALSGEPSVARPAPRFGRLLLKGGLAVIMLAGSFAVGQHFGSFPRPPELARTAVAVPRPAPTAEQHAFPDHLQPRGAEAQTADQVTADFQKQLQQPPTVTPPPGETGARQPPERTPSAWRTDPW
jgi:hypothetical protein